MKKAGLALGGGAVLGAAHVGVIKAIEEIDLEITHISGTSIGAAVAALFAFGKNWKEIQEIGTELKWMDIGGLSLSRYALLSNDKLGELITQHIGDRNIEDAHIPLAMVATNIVNGEKVILDKGNVAQAVMASTAIPGIFSPVEVGEDLLVDGGVIENVPIDTLKELGADYTIGVDLNSNYKHEKPNGILEVIVNSFHFLMRRAAEQQTQKADLLITPDLSEFSKSDLSKVEALMKTGYEEAREVLKGVG